MINLDQCDNSADIYRALNDITLPIDKLDEHFKQAGILTGKALPHSLQLLRLDLLHPIVSGNKLFKLLPFLQLTEKIHYKTLVSFGGRFSNHLHALAYIGHCLNLKTAAFVRGYAEQNSTPMLDEAKAWGMQIFFVGHAEYQLRHTRSVWQERVGCFERALLIPEGGGDFECEAKLPLTQEAQLLVEYRAIASGSLAHLLQRSCQGTYSVAFDVIATAVGSAGFLQLLMQLPQAQHSVLIGVLALKNKEEILEKISSETSHNRSVVKPMSNHQVRLLSSYECGGFARVNASLIDLMCKVYACTGVVLDPLYNAKLLLAIVDRLNSGEWQQQSILLIHSGGLQGGRSLYDKMAKVYGKPLNFV